MYCFEANNCNNLDCPVRKQKLPHCWEYFLLNSATDTEYEKKAAACAKCNYKLGWEIGLISDDSFEKTDRIFPDELVPNENESDTKDDQEVSATKRFCYEMTDCHNLKCPVREQQIIRCFKFFEPRSKEEKERLTCCTRECNDCLYKCSWTLGTINENTFADIIEKKKQKLELPNKYRKDLIVEIYMAELAKKPLSHDEEIALAKKIAGDKYASEIFLMANLKLVTKIAKKFTTKLPFMDLIQEGNIGLIKAISKFDYRLGYKFSTYASYWIKYYMQKAVSEQATSITIPCHLIAVANKIKLHIKKFEEELFRAPTVGELSQILGIDEEKIVNILNVTKTPVSIHLKVSNSEDEEETLEYYIEDKQSLTPEEAYFEKKKVEAINEALGILDDRQRFIIENFYGIGCDEISLAEIGRKYNISRERVRQLLYVSLKKLSQHSSIISLKS